jgi:hypothetical protein
MADTPARGFQYRYELEAEVSFWSEDDQYFVFRTIPGEFHIRLWVPPNKPDAEITAEDIEAGTIFYSEVNVEYWMVALIQKMLFAPVLSLGSWQWNPTGDEINTTICGHVLADGEKPDTIGFESGYADPAEGYDFSNNAIMFSSAWYSPVYRLNIPAGTRLKVDFHNMGYAGLTNPTVFTAVLRATAQGVRDPRQGVCWLADEGGSGVEVSSLLGKQPGPFAADIALATQGVRLLRRPQTTHLMLVYQRTAGLVVMDSPAEGQDGTWHTMAIIPGNYELVATALTEDGGMLYILATVGSQLHMLHVPLGEPTADPAGGTATLPVTDLGAVQGIPANADVALFTAQSGRLHLVVRTSAATYYYSRDGGLTWL